MEFDLSKQIALFLSCAILSGFTIRLAISLAFTYGILDKPGQHKQHKHSTPFVGGTGIFIALLVALFFLLNHSPEQPAKWLGLTVGSIIIFSMGFADDILKLGYRIRLIVQTIVVLTMILVSDVVLTDLGKIWSEELFTLGIFAIPFTLFAAIGSINAFNMIDGIDGLSGSIALTTLMLLELTALSTNNQSAAILTIALAGGTIGFLYFNLRRKQQPRARVFLGDNGSMLLGFLITWLFIALSQNENRAIAPVTALWLFSIPLMDTISIMLRRVWQHKSPFEPDRNHFHHILLDAGYRVNDAIFTIVSIHLLFGIAGLAGLYLGVPDLIMLIGFLLLFSGYFYLSLRPWHLITALRYLHTLWGLIPTESHGFFLGNYTPKEAENLVRALSQELRPSMNSLIQVIKKEASPDDDRNKYAVVVNIRLLDADNTMKKEIERFITSTQQHINTQHGIQLRPFVERNPQSDRRQQSRSYFFKNRRIINQRRSSQELLIFEAMFDQDSLTSTEQPHSNQSKHDK